MLQMKNGRGIAALLVLMGVVALILVSCAQPTPTPTSRPTPTATPRPLTTPTSTPTPPPPTPIPTPSFAGKSVVGYTWGGTTDEGIIASACRTFKEKYGAGCSFIPGSSVGNVAKIIAERSDPQADFLEIDDALVPQVKANQAVYKIDFSKIPNAKNIAKNMNLYGDYLLPRINAVNGYCYRTDLVGKVLPGVTLDKYSDLWRPELKGKVVIGTFAYNFGYQFLEDAAAVAGDPKNLDKGFAKLLELKANLHSVSDSLATMQKMLTDGDVWVANFQHGRCFALLDKGVALRAVYSPTDYPTTGIGGDVMVRQKNADLLYAFFNEVLDGKNQAEGAEFSGYGPTVTNASQYMRVIDRVRMPDTIDELAAIKFVDWDYIQTKRSAFTDRFNKEMVK